MGAVVAVRYLSQPAFVPPALRKAAPVAIPAAAVLGASPAFADKISEASKKFSAASYPFLKSVPWDSDLYAKFPADPQKTLKAIDKVLVMASAMDGKALQTAVEATTRLFLLWTARASHHSQITLLLMTLSAV